MVRRLLVKYPPLQCTSSHRRKVPKSPGLYCGECRNILKYLDVSRLQLSVTSEKSLHNIGMTLRNIRTKPMIRKIKQWLITRTTKVISQLLHLTWPSGWQLLAIFCKKMSSFWQIKKVNGKIYNHKWFGTSMIINQLIISQAVLHHQKGL